MGLLANLLLQASQLKQVQEHAEAAPNYSNWGLTPDGKPVCIDYPDAIDDNDEEEKFNGRN